MALIYMSKSESISTVAIDAAKKAALNTTKLVDNAVNGTLELSSNTTRDTLKTVDVAQSAANTITQSALNVTKSAGNATAELTDTVLKNSMKLTSTGLSNATDIADSSISAASSITKTGMVQATQVTNVALEKTGQISTATINATGNAMVSVLNTVNNVVAKKSMETSAYGQGITSRNVEIQKRGLVKAIEKLFSDNLIDLKTNLMNYVKVQGQMISQLLDLFKSTKCKRGYMGYNCDEPHALLANSFQEELKKLTGYANQNILRMNGLQARVGGSLSKLFSVQIKGDLYEELNREGNDILLPFYTESSEIFQETLVGFEALSKQMNARIKEELKGGRRRTRGRRYKRRTSKI